ncbi:MAG: TniB family NTP-binding protein [Chloroflexi bacterium]|nr:TniB family NTP-binding protein [Chloroflexota bacterium]
MAIRRTAVWLAIAVVLASALAVHAGGSIVWSSTGGPPGGEVNALASAAEPPNTLYAGTNTGVFLSRDNGATWQSVSTGLPDDRAITAFAISPDSKTIFAGTHNGIYKFSPQSNVWAAAPGLEEHFVLALAVDAQNPQIIYAGTLNTLLRSDNNGETWRDAGEGLRPVRVAALAVAIDGSALYAATDAGIFVSRDRGARWQQFSEGLSDSARVQTLVVSSKTILAGTTQGLYRWREGRWVNIGGSFAGAAVRPMVVDARRPDRVYAATSKGLFRSVDGGDTWTALQSIPGESAVLAFTTDDRNALYAGTPRGAWISADDGRTWNPSNAGLVSTSINDLLIPPENPNALLAATRAGLAYSPDRGKTWRAIPDLGDNVLTLARDPALGGNIYAGTLTSAVIVSRDSGVTFTRLTDNVANAPISSLAIVPVANNARQIYAGTLGSGLYKSADDGKTWNNVSNELPGVTRVSLLQLVSSNLYAGTERGLYRLDHSNPKAGWQFVSTELPTEETRELVADSRNAQTLFALFASKGIYRSDDGGKQWQIVGKGTFPTRVRFQSFAISGGAAGILYVGTDRGMYRSDDNGATWIAENDGLAPSTNIVAIAMDSEISQRLFIGTDGYGVLGGNDEIRANGNAWQLPAAIAGAMVLALGAVAVAWRTRYSPTAQEVAWTRDWSLWENSIQHALWTFGQANEINLNRMPRRQLFRALQRYQERHPNDALTLVSAPTPTLKLDSYLAAQKFLGLWKAAWEVVESEEAFHSVCSQMVDQLCLMLGFTRVEDRTFQNMTGFVVRAPALRLKIPPRFPILFIPSHDITENQIGVLRDLMNVLNVTSYFALIIDLRDTPSPDSKPTLKTLVRKNVHDFIVLDGADIRRLLAARDQPRRLVEIILDQVDLTVVSPYVTSGPVSENMFFGRDYEIKTIIRTVRDTNFAIVGGRKIGKTSVLARVNKLLQEMPDYQPFYLDCQAIRTPADFFHAIDTLWPAHLPEASPEGFRRMVTDMRTRYPGKVMVMLFDEIDALLKSDIEQGEPLFRILRALSQEDQVRYIFCGEKILNASLHDGRLVFFNFCNILTLTYLTADEARRVVEDPMNEMGISLENDGALTDEIIFHSARHPNLVQYLCQELIKKINARRDRLIRRADLHALAESAQFADYFAEIAWGNATALERLLTVLMLDSPEVTLPEMADDLRARGLQIAPTELEKAFEGLCLYSILKKDGPKFAFATDALPGILRRTHDVSGLRASLLADIPTAPGAAE